MKLRNLVFVSLALLSLATSMTPQVHSEHIPFHALSADLTVVVRNHGDRTISGAMGVCGSDVHTLDGWEISCKYMAWEDFIVAGGQSVSFSYDFPTGKYTVNVGWSYSFYGEDRGVVEARSFRTFDLHSDQTVIMAVA